MFIFLPLTIVFYYIVPRKFKNLVLLLTSLIFYAWGEPIYILLMLFSITVNYIIGILIDKFKECRRNSLALFIVSLIINLGILCFFKYYGFIITNINNLFNFNIKIVKLSLPLGISFYTFQTMSYIIDVYLGKVDVEKNFIAFATYVTMFPQLIAGPIVKFSDIHKQLNNRKESFMKFGEGVELFIIGLSKKVLLANNIGLLWNTIKNSPISELSVLSAWLGIIGFTFQIYFDFSGYSDMAIGLGKMFGFDIMQNFNYPYISKSATEFWRRWHISLGSWFREYLYIPLGGNRKGNLKQYRNLFVVWFLTGLWHGANWNFILWGLYFCLFLILEKKFLLKWLKNKPAFIAHIYTLIIIVVGWVLFEFEDLSLCFNYIKTMFGFNHVVVINTKFMYYFSSNFILFILLILCSTPLPKKIISKIKIKFKLQSAVLIPLFYLILILISTAYLVNESYNPFLYFRF